MQYIDHTKWCPQEKVAKNDGHRQANGLKPFTVEFRQLSPTVSRIIVQPYNVRLGFLTENEKYSYLENFPLHPSFIFFQSNSYLLILQNFDQ